MNYKGFGQDPNYIYSFRPKNQPLGGLALAGKDITQPIRNSLAYRQAGIERQQSMERAVAMGLPANTDLGKVQKVGIDPSGFGPIYAAPRPQPWGTWGALSSGDVGSTGPFKNSDWRKQQEQKKQPTLTEAAEIKKTQLGEGGGPLAFTPFGERIRQESQPQPKNKSPFPAGKVGSLTGFGGTLRLPYANY
jgi:hypothetical protein